VKVGKKGGVSQEFILRNHKGEKMVYRWEGKSLAKPLPACTTNEKNRCPTFTKVKKVVSGKKNERGKGWDCTRETSIEEKSDTERGLSKNWGCQ